MSNITDVFNCQFLYAAIQSQGSTDLEQVTCEVTMLNNVNQLYRSVVQLGDFQPTKYV